MPSFLLDGFFASIALNIIKMFCFEMVFLFFGTFKFFGTYGTGVFWNLGKVDGFFGLARFQDFFDYVFLGVYMI